MRAKVNPRELSPTTEAWLRKMIPAFGLVRDQMIAAGLIEPLAPPTNTELEAVEHIQEISDRVRERLAKGKACQKS